MAFLQKRLCDSSSFQATLLKNRNGFFTLSLISLLSLMFLTLFGFSLLSVGVKTSTQAQTYCMRGLGQTQKELGEKLEQLLKLNEKARFLSASRKGLEASIVTATASVALIPKVPALQKAKKLVELSQKALIATQKGILVQSQMIKIKHIRTLQSQLKTLKVKKTWEFSLLEKALAVEKEEIGKDAYIYKPVQDFKARQKIKVSWSLPAFDSLKQDLSWIFNFKDHSKGSPLSLNPFQLNRSKLNNLKAFSIRQSCAVTLEQRGEQWIHRLSH